MLSRPQHVLYTPLPGTLPAYSFPPAAGTAATAGAHAPNPFPEKELTRLLATGRPVSAKSWRASQSLQWQKQERPRDLRHRWTTSVLRL